MTITFHKYHGTGNDFIVINGFEQVIPELQPAQIARMCDRHLGIGADGLIILRPDKGLLDFGMDYFNADGHPGSMCGNGGRCAVQFARAEGIFHSVKTRFSAFDGEHWAQVRDQEQISLSMAPAGNISPISDKDWFTDTGSPHVVRLVSNPDKIDVFAEGRKIRQAEVFSPGGTNVNFVSFRNRDIYVRTYERGVENETLSCGTGVVASALVVGKILSLTGGFKIKTRGGNLEVNLSPDLHDITLTGPAIKVFEGELDLNGGWAS